MTIGSFHHGDATMGKFGSVHVGYDFECEKNNGKYYAGEIVKVASYALGTLVTIRFGQEASYFDRYSQNDITVTEPAYRSIYLEDCKYWRTEAPTPQY